MKKFLKRILPPKFVTLVKRYKEISLLKKAYKYDFSIYSSKASFPNSTISAIIKGYHVVEKGLTMPNVRLGFGKENLLELINNCQDYYAHCTQRSDSQFREAISVILEYKEFHLKRNYPIDKELSNAIKHIEKIAIEENISPSQQYYYVKKDDYFSKSSADFKSFSSSRKSIRNFSNNNIPLDLIDQSIELSLNAPSACNRQCSRVRVYSKDSEIKDILSIQNGCRGFGHLANKLIVVTADTSVFKGSSERNQAYIDGGIFLMNLVYSLHYNNIASCILNCSHSPQRDIEMRKVCELSNNEVFIAIIVCGIPPAEFAIANSKRYTINKIKVK